MDNNQKKFALTKQMRKCYLFLIFILLFMISCTVNSVIPSSAIQFGILEGAYDKEDSFFMCNTTENKTLCFVSGSYPLIGETWNLTINLTLNSSSSLRVKMWGYHLHYSIEWEGATEFQVMPGENHSEIYISHFTCDYPAFPAFNITLMNSTGCVYGTYILKKIIEGYSIWIDTGHTYISDISAWLAQSSESLTSSNPTTSLHFLEFSAGILLFLMFKRKYLKSI